MSVAAPAQQPAAPVVGYLGARSLADTAHLVVAFRQGLSEGGFIEGKNLIVDYLWADGHYERLPVLAEKLARNQVSVIVSTGGDPAALAARAATSTIPIVFITGSDPVKAGLVASYNRPGGNATGVNILTSTLEGKRLALMHELVPRARTIGFLMDPAYPAAEAQLQDVEKTARALRLRIHVLRASTDRQIEAAFDTIAQRRIAALLVAAAPLFDTRRDKLVALAAHARIPTMYHFREYAQGGGLISYGIDLSEAYRQVGLYVARVLVGARPADLPVVQPTTFALTINQKTAMALGLTIPQSLLLRADEVIE